MKNKKIIRYAVVGIGHIAQVAVLPAFRHAKRNSKLVALVSGDPKKRDVLQKKYNVVAYDYDEYDSLLKSGLIDAVYIALPNNQHADFTIRAAQRRVHVLCEKPMATTSSECEQMIKACEGNRVKLMIAYRLHFEESNLEAVKIARSRQLGELRFFISTFSQFIREGNYRPDPERGGGPLYDLGVYCINAARYLFREEPLEATAFSASNGNKRFQGTEEMASVTLRFPGEKLAQFVTSFGGADTSAFDVVGTKGSLRLDPAYDYVGPRSMRLTIGEKKKTRKFKFADQFAPELEYFSDCILKDKAVEPSGVDGWNDVRIIEAIRESAASGHSVKIEGLHKEKYPDPQQMKKRPPVTRPELLRVASASQ